ncbi:MAG: hypothetical protein HXX08_13685 [Chloroflexi bacterium]|uniref:6-bladed beta-propeller n=1 Tax=Candidatus Chlorohelix allophototropha TaxID=3003348 RepID=A0A8T7M4A6_9CHLR|nr:hypothetical protein [Chloroflexota bacterium]
MDGQGNVFVSDSSTNPSQSNNDRIQKFDGNGRFLLKWGSQGTGDGQFYFPDGIAVDRQDNIFVADNTASIQKFDKQGHFLLKWDSYNHDIAVDSQGNVFSVGGREMYIQKFDGNGKLLLKWGSQGSVDGQFNNPSGIAVDGQGNIFVADTFNARIQKFRQR